MPVCSTARASETKSGVPGDGGAIRRLAPAFRRARDVSLDTNASAIDSRMSNGLSICLMSHKFLSFLTLVLKAKTVPKRKSPRKHVFSRGSPHSLRSILTGVPINSDQRISSCTYLRSVFREILSAADARERFCAYFWKTFLT